VGWNVFEHVGYPAAPSFIGNISGWHRNGVVNGGGAITLSNICFGGGEPFIGGVEGGGISTDIAHFERTGNQWSTSFNYLYNRRNDQLPNSGLGDGVVSGAYWSITNNVVVAPNPLIFQASTNGSGTIRVSGNTLYASQTNYPRPVVVLRGTNTWDWSSNDYYSTESPIEFFTNGTYNVTFAGWQAAYTDTGSAANNYPAVPDDSVHVIPNQDEAKRAHIAVFNFSLADNVSVSLEGVLTAGDSYQLISAQNYSAGAIRSGIYNGSSISVPMTNLTVATILYGTNINVSGESVVQPSPTSPEFAAFVVMSGGAPATLGSLNIGGNLIIGTP
jgi:hypothetical protein